jgi:predicted phage terminase large subunit-like protein
MNDQIPTSQLTPEMIEEIRTLALNDFYFFAKGVLGYDWLNVRIHLPICKLLEDGNIHELLVVLPRGWQKSTLVSICYPLWKATKNPDMRFLLVQNTATNALAKLKTIADHVKTNELYRILFPEVLPDADCVWRTGSYQLKRTKNNPESTFEGCGITTSINGRHYDEVIEDDTIAPDADDTNALIMMPSKEDVDKCIGFHNSLSSIIINILEGRSIVVGTRWAERDLISHIRQTMGDDVVTYERACREDENGISSETGKLTFPERFNEDVLRRLLKKWGPYMFSCLYMNKPIRSEDMIFQPGWIEYYESEPIQIAVYTTVDAAITEENSNSSDPDYTVVLTAGKCLRTGRIFVLDITRERCNPGRTIEIIFEHVRKWHPLKVGIETIQYQKALAYFVRERQRKQGIYFMIEELTHGGKAKSYRIMGMQPVFSEKLIFIRKWMQELVNELLAFPVGGHDDIIDALAMQLPMWQATKLVEKEANEQFSDPLDFDSAARDLRKSREQKGQFGDMLEPANFSIRDEINYFLN